MSSSQHATARTARNKSVTESIVCLNPSSSTQSVLTIQGLVCRPLKVLQDERGAVMHFLRSDASHFEQFGEVYFSQVNPGVIKGWKLHTEMVQNYAVPVGQIALVVYDERSGSPSYGQINTLITGLGSWQEAHELTESFQLVTVPPGVWYGFCCASAFPALIANCATHVHRPEESKTLPLESPPNPEMKSVLERVIASPAMASYTQQQK